MIGGALSPRPEKPKFSKCSVSNQILGEGFIWLVKVLHGIISPRNLSQSDLFMPQVDYMLFLKSWVWLIQALPNSVRWPPNFGILYPTPPNIYGKTRKIIQNHGDESMGRWKMRLRKSFHRFWSIFLGFPYILGGVGNKIPGLGSHQTEFGRAYIDRTQDLRKSI